jgi:hypothetical protein
MELGRELKDRSCMQLIIVFILIKIIIIKKERAVLDNQGNLIQVRIIRMRKIHLNQYKQISS